MLSRCTAGGFLVLAAALAPGVVSGYQDSHDVLSGEFMYPAASREVWDHVLALAKDLRFSSEKKDDRRQILITRWRTYDDRFPPPEVVELPAGQTPVRVQLHIAVGPRHEPARVSAGAVIDIESRGDPGFARVRVYRPAGFERWILTQLTTRVGVQPDPLAATFEGRKEQSARLMPPGLSSPCATGKREQSRSSGGFTKPVMIAEVEPLFPGGEESRSRVVNVTGVITEHGTVANVKVQGEAASFAAHEASARAAIGLWRFEPATFAGCGIPSLLTVPVNYDGVGRVPHAPEFPE